MSKIAYRIRNWSQYNQSLINRGNITLWLDEKAIASWYDHKPQDRQGRRLTYSDMAIECCLAMRYIYHLPLRQTQGFVEGLCHLLSLPISTPHYSTIALRNSSVATDLQRVSLGNPLHLMIDATGLKVYGEGEWKTRTHGKDKRRVWRKLHLSVDAQTHQIVACKMTSSNTHDSKVVPDLLPEKDKIAAVYGDGAFDTKEVYQHLARRGAKAFIPPRHGAALHPGETWGDVLRNTNIKNIWMWGRKNWKQYSGYHKRSLVETAMFRFKKIMGGDLKSRKWENQGAEIRLKCSLINRITQLGMPQNYKVT